MAGGPSLPQADGPGAHVRAGEAALMTVDDVEQELRPIEVELALLIARHSMNPDLDILLRMQTRLACALSALRTMRKESA